MDERISNDDAISAYHESDAEVTDDEDVEDAANLTFFMSMVDPGRVHESDNNPHHVEIVVTSTDSVKSDEETIRLRRGVRCRAQG